MSGSNRRFRLALYRILLVVIDETGDASHHGRLAWKSTVIAQLSIVPTNHRVLFLLTHSNGVVAQIGRFRRRNRLDRAEFVR